MSTEVLLDRARESYARGHLTVLQLERQIDVAIGLRPKVEVHIGIPSCCFSRHVIGLTDCAESARIKAEHGITW